MNFRKTAIALVAATALGVGTIGATQPAAATPAWVIPAIIVAGVGGLALGARRTTLMPMVRHTQAWCTYVRQPDAGSKIGGRAPSKSAASIKENAAHEIRKPRRSLAGVSRSGSADLLAHVVFYRTDDGGEDRARGTAAHGLADDAADIRRGG